MADGSLIHAASKRPDFNALAGAIDALLAPQLDELLQAKIASEVDLEAWLEQPAYQRRDRLDHGAELAAAARTADEVYEAARGRCWRLFVLDGECASQ